MTLINIDDLLHEETYLTTLSMDTSEAPPSTETPNGSALTAQPACSPPPQRSPPLPDKKFIATKAISKAEATPPEGISNWITEILATFKDLLENKANHQICSMTYLILFMVMNEKHTRFKIFHLVTKFFSADGITEEEVEGKAVRFHGNFIMDQLPTIIHVTDTPFNKINSKAPSIHAIEQVIDTSMITDQAPIPHECSLGE